jgi:hypothetical protein
MWRTYSNPDPHGEVYKEIVTSINRMRLDLEYSPFCVKFAFIKIIKILL